MADYRSPYPDRSLQIALLSGHAIEITPEGRNVPDMFVSHALAAGAIPGRLPRKKAEKTKNSETGLKPDEEPPREPDEEPPREQPVTDIPVNPTGVPAPEQGHDDL